MHVTLDLYPLFDVQINARAVGRRTNYVNDHLLWSEEWSLQMGTRGDCQSTLCGLSGIELSSRTLPRFRTAALGG